MNNLKKIRLNTNKTIGQVAIATGIDRTSLSRMENSIRPLTQNHIEILSKYFNVSTDYLLGKTCENEVKKTPLPEFAYALYGEVEDLTPEQQEEILRLVKTHKSLLIK